MAAALSTAWWWDNILDHVEGGPDDDGEDGVQDGDDEDAHADYVKDDDKDVGKWGDIFVKNSLMG